MKRKAKIEIVRTFERPVGYCYFWHLMGANGQTICYSETFPTRSNALRAARRAVKLMAEAEIK